MKVWNVKLEEMEIMEETIIIVAINAINVIVTAVENKKLIDKSIVKIYHIMYNKKKIQKKIMIRRNISIFIRQIVLS
ncbi:hypothetical protein [Clostridioides difficile]|uniref:hypothetical protein n=1 Tax=Clostridioides difficile TaxID=1496 RepID=UPI001C0DAB3F|nr:hypothetical protein [Clostridioides difficile]